MIDNRAEIHPNAKIADNVEIGPWSVIGPYVEIDEGSWVGPHVVIKGPTRIGKNNRIFQFSSIGDEPQDKKYDGEDTILEIGDNNVIREYVTINRGTITGGGVTRIGNDNWIMAYVHIAHDCMVGSHTIFANNASLAGHVTVKDHAILSAFSGIHQFCAIGEYSFVGKASYVTKDVLPYVLVAGYSPSACNINSVGLKRHGFSADTIENLRRAYKIVFRRGLTVQQALVELHEMLPSCPELKPFIEALQDSSRGVTR